MKTLVYLFIGTFFGILMYKSEAASWFRIFEMFEFGAFHMYGIIGSALVLGVIGVQIIKKFNIKAIGGNDMHLKPKNKSVSRYAIGRCLPRTYVCTYRCRLCFNTPRYFWRAPGHICLRNGQK